MQRALLVLILAAAAGCGVGRNVELSAIHREGPNCIMPGCHEGAGAAGTVYTDLTGTTSRPGAVVEALSDGQVALTIRTDSLGNFLYASPLSGSFIMAIDGITSTSVHILPDDKGCNFCHTLPPPPNSSIGGVPVPGRLFGGPGP